MEAATAGGAAEISPQRCSRTPRLDAGGKIAWEKSFYPWKHCSILEVRRDVAGNVSLTVVRNAAGRDVVSHVPTTHT